MPGLLDFLNTDDARLGLGLLAAGGPSAVPMSFGQRVAGAMQGMDQVKQDKLRNSLLQSQVDENATQADLRRQQMALAQRKQAWDEQFMGGGLLAPAPAAGGGASSPGAAPALPAGASAPGQPAAVAGGFNARAISENYNVPLEAVFADYRFNGGKKIAELIAKRAEPNWVNVNGNLVNTNAPGFTGGVQGGVAASNDGRVTQYMPDGRGGLVVGAPKGALDTYAAFQGVSNRSSADYTPQEVIQPGGRKIVVPRSSVLQPLAGGGGNVQSPGYAGGDRNAANAESIRVIESELRSPGLTAEATAAMQREIARLRMQSGQAGAPAAAPMAGNVVDLSPDEKARDEARRVTAVDTAKADVTRDSTRKGDVKTATKFLDMTKRVKDVFDQGPTASGFGSALDAGAAFVGKSTKGAEAAQSLKALGGWLVANVPRMEGPQSNFDVANYQVMAADVANDKLPLPRRRAALDSIEKMMQDVVKDAPPRAPEGSWDGGADKPKGKVLDALPPANTSNKGQRIRDTTTGKILVSTGLQWKEQ